MTSVDALRVDAVQPPHLLGQVGPRALDDQVVVVAVDVYAEDNTWRTVTLTHAQLAGIPTCNSKGPGNRGRDVFRLRTLILMWLARRAWRLARAMYRRRQARRPRTE